MISHQVCPHSLYENNVAKGEHGESQHRNFPFDLFSCFGTYFFKITNTAEQQTLWLKKNPLELLHPRGEKCGKVVLQLSLAEGISQGYQIVQSWCPYH